MEIWCVYSYRIYSTDVDLPLPLLLIMYEHSDTAPVINYEGVNFFHLCWQEQEWARVRRGRKKERERERKKETRNSSRSTLSPNRSFWIKWIWEKKFISNCRIIYKAKNKETSPCKFLIYFCFSYPLRSSSICLGAASLCFYRGWKIFSENTIYFSAFKPWNVFKLHFLECIDCVLWRGEKESRPSCRREVETI